MIRAIKVVRSSFLPPFDHFPHALCWMRMHFPAVIMIVVVGRIENEWLGQKLTIDDSKSFTNYVRVVTWFPQKLPCRWCHGLGSVRSPIFFFFFCSFLNSSVSVCTITDNKMISTFAVCFIFRTPISFSFVAVDYDSSVFTTISKEWILFGRNVNRVNAEFLSFTTLWTDLKKISTFFYDCR